MNDVDLNRRFLAGDEQAFNSIFRKYYAYVRAHVNQTMRNHPDPAAADADDITQEAFIKVYTARESILDPKKLLGWLKKTAKNAALDSIRAANSAANRLPEGTQRVSYEELYVGDRDVATTSILAERHAAQYDADRERVAQLLRLLRDKDREVVKLMSEGLKPTQIAETIGSTPSAVQKRWERIIKWVAPIARNLEELLTALPKEDRRIMERYLDNQPLSEICEKEGISPAEIEAVVKRVIKDWKKAARQNPTDPVAAMVNKGDKR